MGRRIRYSRPKVAPPERLLDFLCTRFPYLSRGDWARHLQSGHLSVVSVHDDNNDAGNAVAASADYVLRQGDEIRFDPPRELEPAIDEYINILYDDDAVLVCVKNGNLPVAEGGRYSSNTLVDLLARRSSASVVSEGHPDVGKKRERNEKEENEEAEVENVTGDVGSVASCEKLVLYHPVHRLDKETSGLVVLAKQPHAARALSTQFEQQSERLKAGVSKLMDSVGESMRPEVFEVLMSEEKFVTKSYVAVLAGAAVEGSVFVVCDRIGLLSEGLLNRGTTDDVKKHQKLKKLKMACFSGNLKENPERYGRPACSRVCILSSDMSLGISVARVDILTGRTHQIRLHCAQLGYPVLGDKLYRTTTPGVAGGCCAVDDDTYLARVRGGESLINPVAPCLRVKRHLLHAAILSFLHPVTGERVVHFADPREWFLRDVVVSEEEEQQQKVVGETGNAERTVVGSKSSLEALQLLLNRAVGALGVSS